MFLFSLSFEGGNLPPVACPSRSVMPKFCCSGTSVNLRVVFEYSCGRSNSTCHCVLCMRRSHKKAMVAHPCCGVHRCKRRHSPADAPFLFLQRNTQLIVFDAVHFERTCLFLVALVLQSGNV